MPNTTLRQLGITVQELSKNRLTSKSFNQGGQRRTRMVRLDIAIGELNPNVIFHGIDAKTTCNLLVGRA